MNCFQRRMLMKGMGRHCPIRLSLKAVAASCLVVTLIAAIALLAKPETTQQQELKMAAIEAQKDRDELLAVLEGSRALITADGQQYARVEWVKVRELVR